MVNKIFGLLFPELKKLFSVGSTTKKLTVIQMLVLIKSNLSFSHLKPTCFLKGKKRKGLQKKRLTNLHELYCDFLVGKIENYFLVEKKPNLSYLLLESFPVIYKVKIAESTLSYY